MTCNGSYHVYSSAHGDVHSIMQVQLVTFCHPTTQQRRLTPPLQLASIHLHGIRSQRRNFTEGAHLRITLFPPTPTLFLQLPSGTALPLRWAMRGAWWRWEVWFSRVWVCPPTPARLCDCSRRCELCQDLIQLLLMVFFFCKFSRALQAMSLRHPGGYNGMGYLYLHGHSFAFPRRLTTLMRHQASALSRT